MAKDYSLIDVYKMSPRRSPLTRAYPPVKAGRRPPGSHAGLKIYMFSLTFVPIVMVT
jgi:hypothetical protein